MCHAQGGGLTTHDFPIGRFLISGLLGNHGLGLHALFFVQHRHGLTRLHVHQPIRLIGLHHLQGRNCRSPGLIADHLDMGVGFLRRRHPHDRFRGVWL